MGLSLGWRNCSGGGAETCSRTQHISEETSAIRHNSSSFRHSKQTRGRCYLLATQRDALAGKLNGRKIRCEEQRRMDARNFQEANRCGYGWRAKTASRRAQVLRSQKLRQHCRRKNKLCQAHRYSTRHLPMSNAYVDNWCAKNPSWNVQLKNNDRCSMLKYVRVAAGDSKTRQEAEHCAFASIAAITRNANVVSQRLIRLSSIFTTVDEERPAIIRGRVNELEQSSNNAVPHQTSIRVRYAETDQMGVVYYANYFVWMEIGRVELVRCSRLELQRIGAFRRSFSFRCKLRMPLHLPGALRPGDCNSDSGRHGQLPDGGVHL